MNVMNPKSSSPLVIVAQGLQHFDAQTMELTDNCLEIPALDAEHQWTIWKEVVAGFDNDEEWTVDCRRPGFVRFRHTTLTLYCTTICTQP